MNKDANTNTHRKMPSSANKNTNTKRKVSATRCKYNKKYKYEPAGNTNTKRMVSVTEFRQHTQSQIQLASLHLLSCKYKYKYQQYALMMLQRCAALKMFVLRFADSLLVVAIFARSCPPSWSTLQIVIINVVIVAKNSLKVRLVQVF